MHLLKYYICIRLICSEWKFADVVVKKVSDNSFMHKNAERKYAAKDADVCWIVGIGDYLSPLDFVSVNSLVERKVVVSVNCKIFEKSKSGIDKN